MPDDQTVQNVSKPAYYAQGVSDPPNGGQVSSVSPSASDPDTTSDPTVSDSQQTQQPTQTAAQPGTVSNTPPTPASAAVHPSVQRAGLLNDIATALSGGPRYQTNIDPNTGNATRTPVPVSGRQIGLAIALEALSGGLAGLGAKGTNATGQAAAIGLQQGQQIAAQRQQAQQESDQQAQQDFNNQKTSLAQKASIAETNSRTILNTSEAESRGADTIQKLADQNKQLIDDYDAAGVLKQRNVTQQELMDGMKDGRYNATEALGPIDGYRLIGNGQVEATHALIVDPTAKLPVTAEQWQSYADAGVPGWPKLAPGTSIPDGFKISGAQLASANEIKNAMTLAQARHDEVEKALRGSDNPDVQKLAANVPSIKSLMSDLQTSAGLATALERFQKYVNHSDQHGMDLYQSLQQMAQSIPDGKGGMMPNPDSKYASQVMQAFGGPAVLQAYHDEVMPLGIKNPDEAADMLTSNPVGSRAYNYGRVWNRNYAQQEARAAGAKTAAEEGVKASMAANNSGSVFTTPDALGFTPSAAMPGGVKEYVKRQDSYKKQADDLSKTEGTYSQFNDALNDIAKGNFSGARSVVALFDAIGISATPLAGKGFRVNNNVIQEHAQARGWQGALQAKLLNAEAGDVITPQQIKDYAQIAAQARQSQYVNLANQVHNSGLNADFVLPTGNGQKIDPGTAQIFLSLTGNDPQKAMKAATQKGWSF